MARRRPRRPRVPPRRLDRRRVQRRRGRRGRGRRRALFRQVQRVLQAERAVRVLLRAPDGARASAPTARSRARTSTRGPIDVERDGEAVPLFTARASARCSPSSAGPASASTPSRAAPRRSRRPRARRPSCGAPARKAPDASVARARARAPARLRLPRCSRGPARRGRARRRRPRRSGPRRGGPRAGSRAPRRRRGPGGTPRYSITCRPSSGGRMASSSSCSRSSAMRRLELVHAPLRARAPGSGCGWCSRSAAGG